MALDTTAVHLFQKKKILQHKLETAEQYKNTKNFLNLTFHEEFGIPDE
jgi:hypothetical protein